MATVNKLFNISVFQFLAFVSFSFCNSKPNIVFVLTDDQDVTMGGQLPMVKTKKLIGDNGVIFTNMFTTSPLCCPSRSSIMTGRYVHNHGAFNNSLSGGCSSKTWQQKQEIDAFPTKLKSKGYSTFFAGKYLNQYGHQGAGGVEHVPPGWDVWNGLVGNSVYYNYSLSVNGVREKHGDTYPQDYLTDVIHKRARNFLDKRDKSAPFFMMLSTPACHGPFTPAPQYNSSFADKQAPREGSYNKKGDDKHWLIRQAIVPMPDDTVQNSDDIFRRRWRTLQSVDDMVEDIVQTLKQKNLLDNTYIVFSSDNGYHLGQFGLPYDKRQLYEFDIRVPLMVRGPGIKPNQTSNKIVANIDLAPTFLDLVDRTVLPNVDGLSFRPYLYPDQNSSVPLRDFILIEHSGEHVNDVQGCPGYKNQGLNNCDRHCVCEDSWNNTFACLIQLQGASTFKTCELMDNENFVEIYDLKSDPYELTNLYKTMDPKQFSNLQRQLHYLATCKGPQCNSVPSNLLK
ncbi:N-acetylglucosamine-6-sulfatase-like isoform X1 [Mya arenaria]|uniref:N-acetylglucosamine-6-sulfatase-like isoform X1 n=1 Tax=Mya arenaria TaxID=6604 RepID=UPI0022E7F728|nr:N-acetylglucosamine-6-sulfatase-like isoform X1 [Mya arenaria]